MKVTRKYTSTKKIYLVTRENGNKIEVGNLREWARKMKYSYGKLFHTIKTGKPYHGYIVSRMIKDNSNNEVSDN